MSKLKMPVFRDGEVEWLAGLMEGEGSFLKPLKAKPNSPILTVKMSDLDVLQKAASILKTGVTTERAAKPGWKTCFRVSCRGAKAIHVMRLLRPLMGVRRKSQIDAAIAAIDNPAGARRTLTISPDRYSRLVGRLGESEATRIATLVMDGDPAAGNQEDSNDR